jgi:hypothetical protein
MHGQKMSQPSGWTAVAIHGSPDGAVAQTKPPSPRRVGRHARLAGVGDAQLGGLAGGQGLGQLDGHPALGIGPAVGGNRHAVHRDFRHGQQGVQFDHQPVDRRGGGEVQQGDGVDGLFVRDDPDRQVGLVEGHRQLLGRARLVGAQGEGGGFARRRLDRLWAVVTGSTEAAGVAQAARATREAPSRAARQAIKDTEDSRQ